MKKLVTLLISLLLWTSIAVADEPLTPTEWNSVDALIEKSMKEVGAGKRLQQQISRQTGATVVPRKFISRATGNICDECTDFCRDFSLELEKDDGFTTLVYSGRRCIIVPNKSPASGPWQDVQPVDFVEAKSLVPPALMNEARRYLTSLQYIPENSIPSPQSTLGALNAFRADANLSLPSKMEISQSDISALRANASRQNSVGGACQNSTTRFTACGRLN